MAKKQSPFGVINGGLSESPDAPVPAIQTNVHPLGARFLRVTLDEPPPLADPIYSNPDYLLHDTYENFNSAFTNGDRYLLVFEDTNGHAHYYSYKDNIVGGYKEALLSRLNLKLALALTTERTFQDQVPKLVFEGVSEWYQLTSEPLITIEELKSQVPRHLTPASMALKFGITEFPKTGRKTDPDNKPR